MPRSERCPAFWSLITFFLLAPFIISLAGCKVGNYLDPGPNPARIEIEVSAKVPNHKLPGKSGDVVLWDWGLFMVPEQGKWVALGPSPRESMTAVPANPLQRKTVFLCPPGSWRLVLELSGYVMVTRGMGLVPLDVASHKAEWRLNLQPGQTVKFSKRYGPGS